MGILKAEKGSVVAVIPVTITISNTIDIEDILEVLQSKGHQPKNQLFLSSLLVLKLSYLSFQQELLRVRRNMFVPITLITTITPNIIIIEVILQHLESQDP